MNVATPSSFLFLSYEGMHSNPKMWLKAVLKFIGEKNIDEDLLSQSVEYASFENMRRLEQEGRFGNSILRPGNRNDENSHKVRRGKIGGHHEELSADDIAYIDDMIANFDFGVFEEYQ